MVSLRYAPHRVGLEFPPEDSAKLLMECGLEVHPLHEVKHHISEVANEEGPLPSILKARPGYMERSGECAGASVQFD